MDEILALQQELAAVQQSCTTQRLSDRNCVELVMKLQSLRLVDLIFTRSGKEYLTPSQLVLEIQDELLTRGGRLNITDLPDYLNVALSHIETALAEILADPSIKIIRGELVTEYYLSSLVDEIDDSLSASETGTDTLADIATRYNLPADIIRNTIQSRSDQLQCTFDAETMTLISESALQRQRAQAHGMLRGLTSPTTISEAAEAHGLPVAVVVSVLHNMMESGFLIGSLRGRGPRAVYTPTVYTSALANMLSADFTANGFLLQGALTRLHISDIEGFVRSHFPQGIPLSECVVSSIWVDTLSTSATDAIASEGWIDTISALPPGFPENDIPSVISLIAQAVSKNRSERENASGDSKDGETVSESSAKTKGTKTRRRGRRKDNTLGEEQTTEPQTQSVLYGGRYFVSPTVQTSISRVVEMEADKRAHERARVMAERMETVGLSTEIARSAVNGEDDARDPSVSKKGKGKGRRRAGAKGRESLPSNACNEAGIVGEDSSTMVPVSVPTLIEMIELIMAEEVCERFARADYLESGADGEDMILEVLEQTFGETGFVELFHKKAAEAVVELERKRANAKMNSEKQLLSDISVLEIYLRSARALDEELSILSIQYLLDGLATALVCRVLETVARNCGIGGFSTEDTMQCSEKTERLEKLREITSRLPRVFQPRALELIRTVAVKNPSDSTVEEILNIYDALTGAFDLPERRPVDKKVERVISGNLRGQVAETLDAMVATESPAEADMNARQALIKASSVLVYAKLRYGAIVDFAAADAEKFSIYIEKLAEAENNIIMGESLGAVRIASLGGRKSEDSEGPVPWDTVVQKVTSLREIVG